MQKSKVIFLSLVFAVFGIVPSIANNNPDVVSNEIRNEINSLVKSIDLQYMEADEERLNVEFMINSDNQIVVLNTTDSSLEYVVRNRINYKKLNLDGLTKNKIYLVPLVFKKIS